MRDILIDEGFDRQEVTMAMATATPPTKTPRKLQKS